MYQEAWPSAGGYTDGSDQADPTTVLERSVRGKQEKEKDNCRSIAAAGGAESLTRGVATLLLAGRPDAEDGDEARRVS